MKNAPDGPWTDEKIGILKEMWRRGDPLSAIAARLGMKVNQVRPKRGRIGLPGRTNPFQRLPDDQLSPEGLLRRRNRAEEFARRMEKKQTLEIAGRGWTDHENTVLRRQWPTGMPADDIGALINRSGNAVQTRASYMGLERRKPEVVALVRTLPPLECETRYGSLGAFVPVSLGPVPPAKTCQWPVNNKAESLFCDALDLVEGRSYCPEHCAVAFVVKGKDGWWVGSGAHYPAGSSKILEPE